VNPKPNNTKEGYPVEFSSKISPLTRFFQKLDMFYLRLVY